VLDDTTGEWVVNLHFNHDDFVGKVATPHVGQQIAIVYRGVVEAAPTVNAGITGNEVTIAGGFDQQRPRDLADALS
jgi:preprotein translocase subunit SecD